MKSFEPLYEYQCFDVCLGERRFIQILFIPFLEWLIERDAALGTFLSKFETPNACIQELIDVGYDFETTLQTYMNTTFSDEEMEFYTMTRSCFFSTLDLMMAKILREEMDYRQLIQHNIIN